MSHKNSVRTVSYRITTSLFLLSIVRETFTEKKLPFGLTILVLAFDREICQCYCYIFVAIVSNFKASNEIDGANTLAGYVL